MYCTSLAPAVRPLISTHVFYHQYGLFPFFICLEYHIFGKVSNQFCIIRKKFPMSLSSSVPIGSDHLQPPKALHALQSYMQNKKETFCYQNPGRKIMMQKHISFLCAHRKIHPIAIIGGLIELLAIFFTIVLAFKHHR